MEKKPILSAKDVEITFSLRGNKLNAIRKCSLDLYDGETLAIVGESGSGKSVFTKTFVGMLDGNGSITGGSIMYDGKDLAKFKKEKEWMTIRGKKIAMVMQDPMTSCGCFECICGIEPFSNGVVIANREYAGMTPLGMTFSEMASMTGGGVQTPGFMGHGKHFISSKKFMKAEGGIERIVWMPKELKEFVAERLNKTANELYGIENFTDMIGDETIATDPETLVGFLTEKGHPALALDPMM